MYPAQNTSLRECNSKYCRFGCLSISCSTNGNIFVRLPTATLPTKTASVTTLRILILLSIKISKPQEFDIVRHSRFNITIISNCGNRFNSRSKLTRITLLASFYQHSDLTGKTILNVWNNDKKIQNFTYQFF